MTKMLYNLHVLCENLRVSVVKLHHFRNNFKFSKNLFVPISNLNTYHYF